MLNAAIRSIPMSSHNNYRLVLSEEARADIKDILNYTLQKWGKEQQIKYSVLLDTALLAIQNDPNKGRKHSNLAAEIRYYHAGRHYIVYWIKGAEIQVARVLSYDMIRVGQE